MLESVNFKINFMEPGSPMYHAYLLPDRCHVLSISDGSALIFPAVPLEYPATYAQAGEPHLVAILRSNHPTTDESLCSDIYSRLMAMSAYQLLTKYYSDEFDGYPIIIENDTVDAENGGGRP